ncbi:MAG: protein phosphatase CheZ [Geminicoccaceae bacterium]|nr:protein phosphatase CheZ [Geminicoccaceae bacterium]MCB9945121.1 protein phosphatase CheZ [Geminicoccaceae bacterium]
MSAEHSDQDAELREELEELTCQIQATMREVATLRHPMMGHDRVEAAVDELAAIVAATEVATEHILAAAEKLDGIAENLDSEQAAEIGSTVTNIYEACNFQDITGQRISKVMALLRDVDSRLLAMIKHYGQDRFAALPAPSNITREASLLNGPALHRNGLQQDSIDALFG